jgi:hypothetical protein
MLLSEKRKCGHGRTSASPCFAHPPRGRGSGNKQGVMRRDAPVENRRTMDLAPASGFGPEPARSPRRYLSAATPSLSLMMERPNALGGLANSGQSSVKHAGNLRKSRGLFRTHGDGRIRRRTRAPQVATWPVAFAGRPRTIYHRPVVHRGGGGRTKKTHRQISGARPGPRSGPSAPDIWTTRHEVAAARVRPACNGSLWAWHPLPSADLSSPLETSHCVHMCVVSQLPQR